MVWLLCGSLVGLGLLVLVLTVVGLFGRLRREQAAVTALRATVDDGLARLRVTRAHMTEWKRERGGTGHLGTGA